MDVSSHKDSAVEFRCTGSIFLMKLLGLMMKAIKLLLTELVGQRRNIVAPSLFRIDLSSVGQYGKGRGHYIPALTSHSVCLSQFQLGTSLPGNPRENFFERANPGRPGKIFCLIPCPPGKNYGRIPGGAARFSQTRRNCSLSLQKNP